MYEREKERLASMVELEKRREKSAQRRHSAMLVADSLTNLASMYARSKGARYPMATNLATPQSTRLYEARENTTKAKRNYSALMAELAFKNIIESSRPTVPNSNMPTVGRQQAPLGTHANKFARKHAADVLSADNAIARWGRILKNNIKR